ncbi:MAG: AraC family transcriptional regulator [Pseudomonadota bacterium]
MRSDTPRTKTDLPVSTDPLNEVLQLLQMSGTLYCNAEFTDPWGLEIPRIEGVMFVEVITSGQCWLELEGQSPLFLPEGSLVVIPQGNRHQLRGNPGDSVTALEEVPIERIGERFEKMRFGGGGRLTRITYFGVRFDPYLAERLLRMLPTVLQLRTQAQDETWLNSTIRFIKQEAETQPPGSETIITRLADVLVIQVIRAWIRSNQNQQQGWIAALHDVKIGKALSLMHRHPATNWQVDTLAKEVGMSRSGFSEKFSKMVGESVFHYLTQLRIQLARRELITTKDTIAKIAARVGYDSEPAFSRAFKRVTGSAPGAIRKEHTIA